MLYLASKSPRRKEILQMINIPFEAHSSKTNEVKFQNNPIKTVLENSKSKSYDIASKVKNGFILGADTVVYLENKILLKPKDIEDAKKILLLLRNKTHTVYTGVTLINKNKNDITSESIYSVTDVTFVDFSDEILNYYLKEGDYLDKAGAYGIQDLGSILIKKIDGCFYNVMGLPIQETITLLQKMEYFNYYPLLP